jgi:tRNA U38,U39,U40 pseudouridine synthase TruA
MVRNIVGTAVDAGKGKHLPGRVAEILAGPRPRSGGDHSARPRLFLWNVSYGGPIGP